VLKTTPSHPDFTGRVWAAIVELRWSLHLEKKSKENFSVQKKEKQYSMMGGLGNVNATRLEVQLVDYFGYGNKHLQILVTRVAT
jgi:hypothetical protein